MKQFVTKSLEALSFFLYFFIILASAVMGATGGGMMTMMNSRNGFGGGFDGSEFNIVGMIVGGISGFIFATIIFGTLFLLMEIRDLLKAGLANKT